MKLVRPHWINRLRTKPGLWFLIIVSVAFHGLLLALPMPQWWLNSEETEPEPEDILEESGAIALTKLPVVADPEPEIDEPEEPAPPPPEENVPEVIEQAPLTKVPEDIPQEPENTNEPEPVPSAPIPGEPTPDPTDDEPEAGVAFAFKDDFPHAVGSEAGCGSLGLEKNCRTVSGSSFNNVAKDLRQSLRAQNYELEDVTPEDDEDYENHTVFKIIDPSDPDAEPRYLNIFGDGSIFDENFSAFYIITSDIIPREELENQTAGT